jgi:hypothetical protein
MAIGVIDSSMSRHPPLSFLQLSSRAFAENPSGKGGKEELNEVKE